MYMFNSTPYNLFNKSSEFIAHINKRGVIKYIKNSTLNYVLTIQPNGRPPKSGILLCQYLNKLSVKGFNVLDIGTGENALLAIHLAKLGANKIIAIDADGFAVRWAKKNVKINNLTKKIIVKEIKIRKYKPAIKFDLIVSNPAQMPVKRPRSLHDDGGRDGKSCIRQIIKFAKSSLNKHGILIFTAFDFLGVYKSYNNKPSIYNLLTKYLFVPRIVKQYRRTVKPLSYTEDNLSWIKTQYPQYKFFKNKRDLRLHKFFIISAKKM